MCHVVSEKVGVAIGGGVGGGGSRVLGVEEEQLKMTDNRVRRDWG